MCACVCCFLVTGLLRSMEFMRYGLLFFVILLSSCCICSHLIRIIILIMTTAFFPCLLYVTSRLPSLVFWSVHIRIATTIYNLLLLLLPPTFLDLSNSLPLSRLSEQPNLYFCNLCSLPFVCVLLTYDCDATWRCYCCSSSSSTSSSTCICFSFSSFFSLSFV